MRACDCQSSFSASNTVWVSRVVKNFAKEMTRQHQPHSEKMKAVYMRLFLCLTTEQETRKPGTTRRGCTFYFYEEWNSTGQAQSTKRKCRLPSGKEFRNCVLWVSWGWANNNNTCYVILHAELVRVSHTHPEVWSLTESELNVWSGAICCLFLYSSHTSSKIQFPSCVYAVDAAALPLSFSILFFS
jgi:hypothetical protein